MPSPRFPSSVVAWRRGGRRLCAVFSSLLVAGLAHLARAAAPPESDPADARRDLAQIQEAIAELESRLLATQVRSGDSGAAVAQLGLEIALQADRLAEATASRELAQGAVVAAEREIAALEVRRARQERDLRRAVLTLYRMGRNLPLRAMLSIDGRRDVLSPLRTLRYLARSNLQSLSRVRATQVALEARRHQWVQQRDEAARWLERERQRWAQLATARRRHMEILETSRLEGAKLSGLARELTERRDRLERLIELVTSGTADLGGTSMQEFRGALGWPVSGRVRAEFGPRKEARYGTVVPHHGIEMEVARGTPVRAIFAGRVLYAGAFEDVKNLVVVRHPGQVLTLYGGLESVRVSRDDVVAFGAVLGNASDSLYVEVRAGQRAEDPRLWLRGNPSP